MYARVIRKSAIRFCKLSRFLLAYAELAVLLADGTLVLFTYETRKGLRCGVFPHKAGFETRIVADRVLCGAGCTRSGLVWDSARICADRDCWRRAPFLHKARFATILVSFSASCGIGRTRSRLVWDWAYQIAPCVGMASSDCGLRGNGFLGLLRLWVESNRCHGALRNVREWGSELILLGG